MRNAFFVDVNEVNLAQQKDITGKLKAMITDEALPINQKYGAQFHMKSYHRFMFTSNDICVKLTKDDRRNFVLRASDEKCRDKAYFRRLRDNISSEAVIVRGI